MLPVQPTRPVHQNDSRSPYPVMRGTPTHYSQRLFTVILQFFAVIPHFFADIPHFFAVMLHFFAVILHFFAACCTSSPSC